MSVQDYDEMEKLFCGSWKYIGEENWEAFADAAQFNNDLRQAIESNVVVTLTREGECMKQGTPAGNDLVHQINETREWKNREEDPQIHIKIYSTFKDGVLTRDVTPLKANSGKRYVYNMSIQEDVLTSPISSILRPM